MEKKALNIPNVSKELIDFLKTEAEEKDMSVSALVRIILKEYYIKKTKN